MIKNNFLLIIFILFIKSSYGFKPVNRYDYYPSDFGIKYNEIKIKTKDEIELVTWVYEPVISDLNTQTILFLGPDAGNMSNLIEMAAKFQNLGYRVVTFDYRGFGKSSRYSYDSLEFYNELLEIDCETLVDYVNFTYKGKPNVLALSIGSLVLFNMYDDIKFKINKLIVEGGVYNPKEYQKRIHEIKNKDLTKFNERPGYFQNIINYTLILAASEDKYSTIADCIDVLNRSNMIEIIIYNGQHLEGVKILKIKYFEYIDRFLNYQNEGSN